MISHDHKCIFTHVPKTAGKSIRRLFGLPEFEHQYVADGRNIEYGFGHWPLSRFVDEGYFADYFKFAFVRNPFDRIVSAYFYLASGGCNEDDEKYCEQYLKPYEGNFAAFVEDLPTLISAPHFRPQADWICDQRRRVLANFIGRYENLEVDLCVITNRLAVSFHKLPVLNASKHEAYRSYYDEATKRRVTRIYGDDLELFAYRFG
jgi:chondroitin 4-sulfotransferase 11